MQSSTGDIQKILTDMRLGMDSNRFQPINRSKNIRTLTNLGLTWEDAKEEIYKLGVNEYVSGPDADRDRPGTDDFWKFKKVISGFTIYIKFKVEYMNDGKVKVVSFHLDGL